MEVVYPRCCGIDAHKRTVTACRVLPGADGRPVKEVRTFGTMTPDLLALSDWLAAQAAGRSTTSELGARYWRLAARRGKKKAAVAVGRVILEAIYHMLSTGECYDDTRVRSLEQGDLLREQRRLVRRLEEMGHQVILRPAA